MCLILFAWRVHPRHRLLVAANRDEFHARPTAPLAFWEDAPQILAGRDLKENGTWMGVNRAGAFAAITNYRDPHHVLAHAPSRGHLVSDYLRGSQSAQMYLEALLPRVGDYNGFNLLLGDETGLYCVSNCSNNPEILALKPGVYGLSNHLLDTPWFKLERGRNGLRQLLTTQTDPTLDDLLGLLTDRTPALDEELPQTGVPLEWERWLSPIFIDTPSYGTRSSTALFMDESGDTTVAEMTWVDESRREFRLKG